jgi:hypothetical protein
MEGENAISYNPCNPRIPWLKSKSPEMNFTANFASIVGLRLAISSLAIAAALMTFTVAGSPPPTPAPSPAQPSATPQPFAPVPFQLEPAHPLPAPSLNSEKSGGMRIDFPLGPVRVDYGIPYREDRVQENGQFYFHILRGDFPGPGYREQRAAPSWQTFPPTRANTKSVLN